MKTKLCILLVILFCFVHASFSQEWVKMMKDPKANFYDVQRAFNKYEEQRKANNKEQYERDQLCENDKDERWRVYKRWEYMMEPRVHPTGIRPAPDQAWKEYTQYMSKHPQIFNKNQSATIWKALGPFSFINMGSTSSIGHGRINCMAVDPTNSNILYAGAPAGGLWKSTDGGNNWNPLTDYQPVLGVSGIAINPLNTKTIYIATGDGDAGDTYSVGVLKSLDGGKTWDVTGLSWNVTQNYTTKKIIISPIDTNVLLAATDIGLYRTADGGFTWLRVQNGNFTDIEFMPGNTSVVYASSQYFYRSSDTGNSFTSISSIPYSYKLAIGVTPAAPDYVYVCAYNYGITSYDIHLSTDTGLSFSFQAATDPDVDGNNQGWYAFAFAVSPTNKNELYAGGLDIWKSTDGGLGWTPVSGWWNGVHVDIHSLEFLGNTLYTGNDGGLYKTTNQGSSWNNLNDGLQIMQFYRIGSYAYNSEIVYGGAQDNGTNQYSSGNWDHVLGADGFECFVDYSNSNNVFASTQNGSLNKSTDGGNNFSSLNNGFPGGLWLTPWQMSSNNNKVLFAGGINGVYKSTKSGSGTWGSWTKIFAPTNNPISALAVAPSDDNYIFAFSYNSGSGSKGFYKTNDGGITKKNIYTGKIYNKFISYIAVHPTDTNRIWATASGYEAGNKVFYSSNCGVTWNNISGTLPNLPANCIVVSNGDKNGVYVGMDVGVYYYDSTMTDWVPVMNGLPNVIINELEVNFTDRKLLAGTYGRGLWALDSIEIPNGYRENQAILEENISIYPNPTANKFIIDYHLLSKPVRTIRIYNILGEKVTEIVPKNSQNPIDIDFSGNPSGMYLVNLEMDGKILSKKIFKISE